MGSEWLQIGGIKMSIDGGFTGKNAAFREPIASDDGHHEGLIRIGGAPDMLYDEISYGRKSATFQHSSILPASGGYDGCSSCVLSALSHNRGDETWRR
jgi:hypothetical protein